jgi:hypothetical protein
MSPAPSFTEPRGSCAPIGAVASCRHAWRAALGRERGARRGGDGSMRAGSQELGPAHSGALPQRCFDVPGHGRRHCNQRSRNECLSASRGAGLLSAGESTPRALVCDSVTCRINPPPHPSACPCFERTHTHTHTHTVHNHVRKCTTTSAIHAAQPPHARRDAAPLCSCTSWFYNFESEVCRQSPVAV